MSKLIFLLLVGMSFVTSAQINSVVSIDGKQVVYRAYVVKNKTENGKKYYNLLNSSIYFLLSEELSAFSKYDKLLARSAYTQENLLVTVDTKLNKIISVKSTRLKPE